MATVPVSETHPGITSYEEVNRDILKMLARPGRGIRKFHEPEILGTEGLDGAHLQDTSLGSRRSEGPLPFP